MSVGPSDDGYDEREAESFVFDDNDNRATSATGQHQIEDDNQTANDGKYLYTYDAEGNRTARFVDDGDELNSKT